MLASTADGTLGSPIVLLKSPLLDLANPNVNVTAITAMATTAAATEAPPIMPDTTVTTLMVSNAKNESVVK